MLATKARGHRPRLQFRSVGLCLRCKWILNTISAAFSTRLALSSDDGLIDEQTCNRGKREDRHHRKLSGAGVVMYLSNNQITDRPDNQTLYNQSLVIRSLGQSF